MGERCEFECVPMMCAVRDRVAQIGNHISKSEASAILLDTRISSRRRLQYQEGEELRKCWNEANLCFSTAATLQVCRIGILWAMDPTLHYKMKADEAHDGSGEGCSLGMYTETRCRNRQFSVS